MNCSPQTAHWSPRSTNVYPSISEVMSSAGTSLRFPQLGHRMLHRTLGSFMRMAPPPGTHANPDRLPRHLRVQLAGPPRLLRCARETAGGRTPEEPRGDARIVEEHLPSHPLGPRRLAERVRPRRVRGSRDAGERLRRSPVDGAASRVHGENHRERKTIPLEAHR